VRQGAARGSFALRARPAAPADDAKTGLYRRADGSAVGVVATQFGRAVIDYSSGEIRSLHGRGPGRDLVGAGITLQNPISGELRFAGNGLSWHGVDASRVALRSFEVRFPSRGATLSGTLTLPPGAGPFAAAALVHGSGPMPRENQLVFALYLASRGIATLVYDKRGIGWSGGTYGGDSASQETIDVLARDAEAAARLLAAQPEVDRARVGLVGVSQAGWIMPLAATREAAVRFLVPLVGPTVTQGESDAWGHGIGMGADTVRTFADVEAEVRAAGPSGVDPLPWIRALAIPALWVWGGNDRHVPTALCVARLAPLAADTARDLDYVVLPRANHGLVDSEHGLSDEVAASSRFAAGLFEALDGWLRAHGLA
jgi:dienelactone hydrolase